jgi:intracellular septation protein A
MRDLFRAARVLLLDMASMVLFLVVVVITDNLILSAALGMVLGVEQTAWQFYKRQPVEALQWLSVVQVLAAGTATLLTDNAIFMMLKPSVVAVILGLVMLRRGWMNRYLPPVALATMADVGVIFGFVWAGLMFFTAALNVAMALVLDTRTWAAVMSAWGIASNVGLFLVQYFIMNVIGRRRSEPLEPRDQGSGATRATRAQ